MTTKNLSRLKELLEKKYESLKIKFLEENDDKRKEEIELTGLTLRLIQELAEEKAREKHMSGILRTEKSSAGFLNDPNGLIGRVAGYGSVAATPPNPILSVKMDELSENNIDPSKVSSD